MPAPIQSDRTAHAAPPTRAAAQFQLVSQWHLAAPVDAVWEALKATERWPAWWRYVRSVQELRPGDADGLGAVRHIEWGSRLPYGVAFDVEVTELERPRRLAGRARGQLEGVGLWELTPDRAPAPRAWRGI